MRFFKLKIFFVFLISCLFCGCDAGAQGPVRVDSRAYHVDDAQKIYSAYQSHQSDFFVESSGVVVKILSDDLEGSRHQRFILKLFHEQTILIAHNIDIAPRIKDLSIGDQVYFRGEYVWNDKGGVVHWTHHDLQHRKSGGWLEYNSMRYE